MRVTAFLGLLPGLALASDVLSVALRAKDSKDLYNVIRDNSDLDYGCRPVIMRSEGEHKLHATVSGAQLDMLKRSLDSDVVRIDMLENLNKRQAQTAPIGKGDRFQGGKIAPRGLGSRKAGESAALGPILNVDEVTSALKGLANQYKMETFTLPYKTYEGQTVTGGVANKAEQKKKDKQYIYLTSGIHARERGGPDNLIYFISDLLYANEHRTGLTYGNKTYTNSQVKTALGTGIVFVPLTNPDGVRYDQKNGNRWRKNRNPASSTPGNARTVGVDLNRNFDFLWNYTKHFDPSVSPASNNPSSEAFYGTAPFSEPETKNYAWVYDQFPKIRWFIDVHSAAGTVLYSWGDDVNQASDPTQNLFNPEFDGKRGVVEDSLYREFIDEQDWYNVALQANRTTNAMTAVGGRDYVPQAAVGLYPTSGASDDWSFSRWHKDKNVNKVYGYTMEFGYPTNFYPTSEEYINNIIDTNAGFMEFCLTADEIGLKD
ncbi:zinc carboxypeptidase A 1 precursor [Massariosphaeria phaeospora]|uniref:Zinc carboxypeptidase A 1 n=1 Tax=Massariosphaeria phaeospora TaxID=100035 RepID=A0A7C8M823_9PLEO|nr:zinc carboxypeptidase A 1 precursor [Massariosphaeria phaeospora]